MTTTNEAAKLAGVSYRQLDYWITCGYIRLNDPNPGSGQPRRLPASQLAILLRMAELVRAGMNAEPAARLARRLRREGEIRVGRFTITDWPEEAA